MLRFPEIPDVPADQTTQGNIRILDYHDVCQDGRVMACPLVPAIGHLVWRNILSNHPLSQREMSQDIEIPLLTKLFIRAQDEPITLRRPIQSRGGLEFAHTRGENGDVERLVVNMWAELSGTRGRMYTPPADGAPTVSIGKVYAEHVVTRPFAPRERRKVTKFEVEGMPEVPPTQRDWTPPSALLELPDGATPLDAELVDDPAPFVVGVQHTDSNQHVNSAVYPTLFEDVALRRIAAHREAGRLLMRQVEVAYRKPTFSGNRLRIAARAFELDGNPGAVGVFYDDDPTRARCFLRVLFCE